MRLSIILILLDRSWAIILTKFLRISFVAILISHDIIGQEINIKLYPKRQSNGYYGYVNKSGNLIIDGKYDKAFSFSGSYAKVISDKKWGLINKDGKYLIKPKYDYLGWSNDPYYEKKCLKYLIEQ